MNDKQLASNSSMRGTVLFFLNISIMWCICIPLHGIGVRKPGPATFWKVLGGKS